MNITEIENTNYPRNTKAPKENMHLNIPGIDEDLGIPYQNGFIWFFVAPPRSGKTYQLLSMFKNKKLLRCKFDNIFYLCPLASMMSVEKHPFEDHDKTINDLTPKILDDIYEYLDNLKVTESNEYSCLIIDDFGNKLKESKAMQDALKRILIKSGHLKLATIVTVQNFFLIPSDLRQYITHMTVFKTRLRDYEAIYKEYLQNFVPPSQKTDFYNYVFHEKYNHLMIDKKEECLLKNFNKLIIK